MYHKINSTTETLYNISELIKQVLPKFFIPVVQNLQRPENVLT